MTEIGFAEIMKTFFGAEPTADDLHVNDDGNVEFGYRNEVQARQNLARLAYAYGWVVEEEVVIPGWGRVDLVLREYPTTRPRLIELKVDLKQPAKVRRAFQQCDGYGRWWTRHHEEPCNTVLIGCNVDRAVVQPIAAAYPEVAFGDVGQLMTSLATWDPSSRRQITAAGRAEQLRRQLAVHEWAISQLRRAYERSTERDS